MAEFKYEILQEIGIVSANKKTGCTRELNIISWNSKEPELDFREWGKNRELIGKGISISLLELNELIMLFLDYEITIRKILEPSLSSYVTPTFDWFSKQTNL